MHDFLFLRDILVLLGLAVFNAYLFSRLRLSPIIGYLVTGLLVGPFGFHLISSVDDVEIMAEVGVILLLFTIGLEFSITRIIRLKGPMLKSGLVQVVLTTGLVFVAAIFFNIDWRSALALGMALALSSTAIVLKLLLEGGDIDAVHGRISLAVLLCQDLCVIVFLLLLPLLGDDFVQPSLFSLMRSVVLLGGLFLFARHLLQPLMRGVLETRSAELFRLMILTLVLGTAWVTFEAGLSLALGAFLAGLALAESDYSHQVLSDIIPFRDAFLAIFFISMGMLVDLRILIDDWPIILAGFLLVIFLKIVATTFATLVSQYPLRVALTTGLILFQVGEFSFILMKKALILNVVSEPIYQSTLLIIALTMMVTPFIVGRAPAMATRMSGWCGAKKEEWSDEEKERTGNLEGHVIIAGFGLAGKTVARVLREMHIPYLHIELNGEIVRRARQNGEFIVYGDATSPVVLEGVGIARARALVIAINDPAALTRVIRTARDLNDSIYILARTSFILEMDDLLAHGADMVIPDEVEASLRMAAVLLRQFSIPEGQSLRQIAALRQEHYGSSRAGSEPSRNLAGYISVLEGGQIEFQAMPDDSPLLNQTLAEIAMKDVAEVMVVGVIRHERIHYGVSGSFRLLAGDTLMLLGEPEAVAKARELLHGHPL
jgi:CPA2 family monovalent cation:H+ antiporter-2